MANEQNHNTLRSAIQRLSQHEPSQTLWQTIENQLESDLVFENTIQALPTYAPPAAVWNQIESDLKKPRTFYLNKRFQVIGMAAIAVGLTIGTYFWLQQTPEPTEKVQIIYAEAETATNATKADWDEDDAEITEIASTYAQQPTFVTSDKSLLSELEELNQAKEEIKIMLKKYGKDSDLIRTIADIERQRSTIVKRMANSI